ncbi:MAG: 4Fe-4S binding protein, partial [Elusimicrobiota bacterium]|nr:4Fe-4S binding protein [Elusimicrobiota bacterium]
MKYPKLRELKETIKAIFTGPYTTRFPYEPHKPQERFRGKPIPDEKECIGCGACAEVCPANAIEVIDPVTPITQSPNYPITRSIVWHYDLCIFCGQCERLCTLPYPKKGVKLSNTEYDLSTFDRKSLFTEIKKELVLCEFCGKIIAPKDQILWIAKKLRSMSYGNYLVFSLMQESLGIGKMLSKIGLVQQMPFQRL